MRKSLDEAIEVLLTAERGEPKWGFVKRQLAIAYGRNGRLADADVTLAEEALLAQRQAARHTDGKTRLSNKSATDHVKAKAKDILFQLNIPAKQTDACRLIFLNLLPIYD